MKKNVYAEIYLSRTANLESSSSNFCSKNQSGWMCKIFGSACSTKAKLKINVRKNYDFFSKITLPKNSSLYICVRNSKVRRKLIKKFKQISCCLYASIFYITVYFEKVHHIFMFSVQTFQCSSF